MSALADRVKESTTTTGTGSLTLSGAVTQFESFNTAFGTANPFYYVITDANGTDWEVGTGQLSDATTLVRTTVHQSSNGDAKVNLSAGTHTVFCSAPAVFLADRASKTGKLSQFAATTSAELAGVISDETGTGVLVFATSPTLTTPNIGVATATSVNGTTIPSSKTLVVTTDKLSALAATTSSELAGVISDETGSGSLVFATSPSLTTPNIGAATATSVNGTTIPSSKTLVVTTDKLSALAATTSAELAGVISDETGSGSLVFATSPSLTTPNLGTPSAGTLSNCTGLPVGGVSGLGTGVATALAVNTGSAGAVVVNGGALGTPSSGTLTSCSGLPVSTGVSGLGTGVATALAVNTGSSGAVVVNGGPLGTPSSGTVTNLTGTASININGTVGATTPTTGAFTTVSASGVATFSAGTVTAPAITTSGDTNTGEYFPAADTIAWTTGGTERMRVDSSGNVGIGVTPTAKFDVYGAKYAPLSGYQVVGQLFSTDSLAADVGAGLALGGKFNSTDVTVFAQVAGVKANATSGNFDGAMLFSTRVNGGGLTERMRVDSSGNVGIGTSSPGNKFTVVGGRSDFAAASEPYALGVRYSSSAGIYYIGATNSATPDLVFSQVGGSERMRVTNDGNVGIGTSSPSQRFHVKGSGTTSGTIALYVTNSAPTETFYVRDDGAINTGTAAVSPYNNTTGLSANMFVGSDGFIYRSTSSLRYKTDIQDATHGLADVLKLRSVTYKGKNDGDKVFGGFIAEEVHEAGLIEFVAYDKDNQPDALHYGNMVALLVKSIQEQQQQIDALKAEVAALKGNA
jgi:hypothetical protein